LGLALACAVAYGCEDADGRAAGRSRGEPPVASGFASAIDEFLHAAYVEHPVWATEMGFHAVDGKLDSFSPAARATQLEWLRRERRHFADFDPGRLALDDRVDRDILLHHLDGEIFEMESLRPWQNDPLLYTQLAGNSIHLLLEREVRPLEDRLRDACTRLGEFPRLLGEARQNLDNPPHVYTQTAIRQTQGIAQILQEALPRVAKGTILEEDVQRATQEAGRALDAYTRFLEDDLLPRSNGDVRLGRKRFDRKLELVLQTDLSSREIRRRAERECLRVRREMYDIALPLYREMFPDSVPPGAVGGGGAPSDSAMQRTVRAVLERIAIKHPWPHELLGVCRAAVDSLTRFVAARHLVDLDSTQSLVVEWTPDFARGVAVAGLDAPGPLERRAGAAYDVQPVPQDWRYAQAESYLREYNYYMLQVLSMHEAVPGHFVQLCHAGRCASPVRSLFANAPFVEGWAVYAERLTVDAGYMHGDKRLALEQRKLYLRTVLNALLDIGVHCDGMTEDEGVAMLREQGFQEESEARGKWRRAQLGSTQLCAYFVGVQEILDLRAADRARLGAAWSTHDFNERLLAHGAPPVRHLRALLLGADPSESPGRDPAAP
jgi:uncharacterized protein (DUF885 family)